MSPIARGSKCPQCGARTVEGQIYCGGCGTLLIFCGACGAANLHDTQFCHVCGQPLKQAKIQADIPSQVQAPTVERMRICPSCKKVIGAREPFCSYCGKKMRAVHEEFQPVLDRRTMKVMDLMVEKVIEAKNYPEYKLVDERSSEIADVALRENQPRDAQELSFSDQRRLLALVFEYTRDKVPYKGESFGDYVRWPWETLKTGGDCDCKVVLLASLMSCLNYRKMFILVLPAGTYLNSKEGKEERIQGHALLEVVLDDGDREIPVRLDPSCEYCDIDEIPDSITPFMSNFYRMPIMP